MYYPAHHIIFVAINKCGSSSVLNALNNALYDPNVPDLWKLNGTNKVSRVHDFLKHAQAFFYLHQLGEEEFNRCFVFSQVRNPWDKVVSDFYFRCGTPKKMDHWNQQRKWFIKHGLLEPTDNPGLELFDLYVRALESKEQVPHRHWRAISSKHQLADIDKDNTNQLDGLTDLNGNLIVDEILRFEELSTNWTAVQKTIRKRTGITLGNPPHLNKSNRDTYKRYYNDQTYEIVKELFNRDIKAFDYVF